VISEKLGYLETVMSVLAMREVARETGCGMATAAIALGAEMEGWGGRSEPLTIEAYNAVIEGAIAGVKEAQDGVTVLRMIGAVVGEAKWQVINSKGEVMFDSDGFMKEGYRPE
jgi:hypothetical protein